MRRTDRDGPPRLGPGGRPSWGYGGDFGDEPNDANFVCDGLVDAARVPHAVMAEVHHVGRPARVELDGRRRLVVHNRRWFRDLDDLAARWTLHEDGVEVASGVLEVPSLAPRGRRRVALPASLRRRRPGAGEEHLTITWTQRRRTAWAPAGHVVGTDQVVWTAEGPTEHPAAAGSSGAGVGGAGLDVAALAWRPTLFRALTDNDGLRQGWMRGLVGELHRWVDDWGLDEETFRVERSSQRRAGDVAVTTTTGRLRAARVDAPVEVRRTVRAHATGWSQLVVDLRVPRELADPPRVGIELVLDAAPDGTSWEQVEWFGEGPHECYPDRRAAARVGRWSRSVDDLYEDHVVPQEHGHRTGLRWVALTRGDRRRGEREGLLVVADPGRRGTRPGFAVRRHSDADLWAARHSDDLDDHVDGPVVLHLDAAQRGLGTGACGPDALERYRIPAGTHRVAVWIRGFDPATEDPGELARQRPVP
ncbi:MAG: beta-galactosidase small subunit-related protein [Microthrixaceae bacterium]